MLISAALLRAAQFIPVAEVSPGMKGYGLTCLRPGVPMRFDVEIVGVLTGFVPGLPVILAKIADPELEKTGVFAGMSGSPVYIGDRLLGAVAYTWSFLKDPMCGITPAEEMARARPTANARLTNSQYETLLTADSARAVSALWPMNHAAAEDRPVFAPLALHGGALPACLLPLFNGMGLVAAQGGGAGNDAPYPLEGGYPIGAALAWGDISFFASGTITWRDGDHLYAFGHPLLGIAPAGFPLAEAHPLAVISRLQSSFRISNMGRILGSVDADTGAGISGLLGAAPRGIPVVLEIGGHVKKFWVADHPVIGPAFAAAGSVALLQQELGGILAGTAVVTVDIRSVDGPDFTARECVSGPDAADQLAGAILFYPLLLASNPWKEFRLKELHVAVSFRPEVEKAHVVSAETDRGVVEPGRKLRLHVRFRDREGADAESWYDVTVPMGIPPDSLSLIVGAARDVEDLFRKAVPFKPKSFEGLLRLLETQRPQGDLMAVWKIARPSLLDEDRLYPGSAPDLITRLPDAQKLPFTLIRQVLDRKDIPLDGVEEIKLTVRN